MYPDPLRASLKDMVLLSLFFGVFVMGVTVACGETDNHPKDPCLPASVESVTELSGDLSITSGGRTDEWSFDSTGDATSLCSVDLGDSFVWNADLHSLKTPVNVDCEGQTSVRFSVFDLRRLEMGTHQLTSEDLDLWISYLNPGEQSDCYSYLDPMDYTIIVEEAEGELSPYPEIVTGDFLRTARVELSLSLDSYPGQSWYGGELHDCTLSLSGELSFTVSLTADDISSLPEDSCIIE